MKAAELAERQGTPAAETGAAHQARQGGAAALAAALQASRSDTLALLACWRAARPTLQVPLREALNPPLWELGHIGWFQGWWTTRFPAWAEGVQADPDGPRLPARLADAESLYHSSRVPHDARWSLPLPGLQATLDDLASQQEETLLLLERAASEASLYFFRLALLHEDMHHEASLMMAHALGIPVDDVRWQPRALPPTRPPLHWPAGTWRLGHAEPGFAFDNELACHTVDVPAVTMDAQVVRWSAFLGFVEAGGYGQPGWWDESGWRWRLSAQATGPQGVRARGSGWQTFRHGVWTDLDGDEPACHLTAHEARAWCRWAGRRLPTEAEWERAAVEGGADFEWGQVWEWTASAFQPYPGFRPHPYRDYSAPWFDGRPVLRGASVWTQPRMRHARYRNFFPAHRRDVAAGFRSCA